MQTGHDAAPGRAAQAPENNAAPPERIGRYCIKRLLGNGAFGFVYQGYDEALKRRVAIKVPHHRRLKRPEDVAVYLAEA